MLLRRLVNSVRLIRFALDVDRRFSAVLRCKAEAVAISNPSSGDFARVDGEGEAVRPASGTIPASWG